MRLSKIIYIILLSCVLLVSLFGCSNQTKNSNQEFEVLEIGSFDDLDGGKHVSEYSPWAPKELNYHQDSTAPKESAIVFNGVTYSGQYQCSATFIPNTYVSHRYKGANAFFEINGSTGELSYIIFIYEPSEKSTLSETECRNVADQIAKQFIKFDEYKVDTFVQSIHENSLFSFTYYREVNGYKTSDSLTIAIDGNGNVSSFGVNMLGAFENATCISLDEKQVAEMLETKMNDIYAQSTTRKDYDVGKVVLVKLKDGRDAFLYTVTNYFGTENEQYSSQIRLLITASEKD